MLFVALLLLWNMPTGEPPHKKKGSAPVYLPHKVVWKKYKYNFSPSLILVNVVCSFVVVVEYAYRGTATLNKKVRHCT